MAREILTHEELAVRLKLGSKTLLKYLADPDFPRLQLAPTMALRFDLDAVVEYMTKTGKEDPPE